MLKHNASAVLGEHTARTVHIPNMQAPVVVPIDNLIQGYIGVGASASGRGLPVNRILGGKAAGGSVTDRLVAPVTVGTVPVSVGTVPHECTGKAAVDGGAGLGIVTCEHICTVYCKQYIY